MSPALRIKLFFALAALCLASAVRAQDGAYAVSGRVIDRLTRQPVAYAAVVPVGQEQRGASTDSLGRFRLERVRAGIFRLSASSVGYKTVVTPEYLVSAATPFIEIEMEEDATQLEAVTVVPSPFRATAESPVGLQVIGVREIEKSPGANRDVSRIVRSYPGVSFSPVGYRNDLIVRGGGPSENKFYLDGIEIPNINHFATQGATGGPVSILNADLIRAKFKPGMVLVVPSTSNEMLSYVRDAAALVVEEAGLNSHAAIAGKALLKPTIVGAVGATAHIRDGLMVAVDCAHGSVQRLQA